MNGIRRMTFKVVPLASTHSHAHTKNTYSLHLDPRRRLWELTVPWDKAFRPQSALLVSRTACFLVVG